MSILAQQRSGQAPLRQVWLHFAKLLNKLVASSPGSSTRVCRLLLLKEPPSMDLGEMTDKGSINQRAVLKNRAALVDELYRQPVSPRVIAIDEQV